MLLACCYKCTTSKFQAIAQPLTQKVQTTQKNWKNIEKSTENINNTLFKINLSDLPDLSENPYIFRTPNAYGYTDSVYYK
jgi:hypothetical protein